MPRKIRVATAATTPASQAQMLAREERKASLAWSRMLKEFGDAAAKEYTKNGKTTAAQADLRKATAVALPVTWRNSATAFAKGTFAQITGKGKKASKKPRAIISKPDAARIPSLVDSIVEGRTNLYGAEKVKSISDTQKAKVKRIIANGTNDGLSIDDIADLIEEEYSFRGVYSDATRIARTEVHTAAMAGANAGAQATGLELMKTWNNVNDGRVRSEHMAAQGQTVPINAKFSVGGEKLDYPGDPSGGASEVINCRCYVAYGES